MLQGERVSDCNQTQLHPPDFCRKSVTRHLELGHNSETYRILTPTGKICYITHTTVAQYGKFTEIYKIKRMG